MDNTLYWFVYWTLAVLAISLTLNLTLFFRFARISKRNRFRRAAQNLMLVVLAIVFTLLALELFFKLFFAQTDGFNYTLASKNWFERHWHTNSLGYRDIEWTPEKVAGHTKIMVLGDSFVAGYGIEKEEDRFSNLLGQQLGDSYAVMNVGELGASTKTEIENALSYPYPPDVIILSFYVNDIQDTAKSMGYNRPAAQNEGPFPVDYSYALNFFYWRVYRLGAQEWSDQYWNWLSGLYDNPDIWEIYQQELLQIADFINQNDGRLVVVVFPNLADVEGSRRITSGVTQLYRDHNVPVLDVTDLVAGMAPADLIASPVDSHPNEWVHSLVAEKLYPLVIENQSSSEE